MSSTPLAVETLDLAKHYDGGLIRALDGVSLAVAPGELVAITGPSGGGKSTLLHLIAALDTPTSGVVRVDGVDLRHVHSPSEFRRTHIGLVFQLHNLLAHLTAAQNVEVAMFGTHRRRRERAERARELLALVGLVGGVDRVPPKLSGGERQRVAIARALANDPALLLADEPTGSLDSAGVTLVLDLLVRLRAEEGLTIVLVTHDPVVAAADRVVQLVDGRVVVEPVSVT